MERKEEEKAKALYRAGNSRDLYRNGMISLLIPGCQTIIPNDTYKHKEGNLLMIAEGCTHDPNTFPRGYLASRFLRGSNFQPA